MPRRLSSSPAPRTGLRDLLTFQRMFTGQTIHLVYWAGLCVIAMVIFAVVGIAVGQAIGGGLQGVLLAFPVLVVGLLVAGAMALLWRSFCEFYLTIYRIGEDLRAIRAASDAGQRPPGL
ncbi:MAG: DUF4282 domain-containing protein [Proteobacteria bacterium]|nr:DUF4282 domain-containing protein [Pseudomonadota bacterium]MBW3617984.1 DUF4282 domain-containing protein [Pseudomonadota bacterium]